MPEIDIVIDQPLLYAGIALALVLVVWATWRGTRALPPVGRWLARSLLVIAVALPLMLTYIAPLEMGAGPDERAGPTPTRPDAPRGDPTDSARETSGDDKSRLQERAERGPTSRGIQPKSTDNELTTRSAGGSVEANEDWDVVPVFYGTDRARETQKANRIVYGAERAKRLELGRALVTVPKVHEVPNIERPWVYRLPFVNVVVYEEKEDPKKHFTLRRVEALDESRFLAIVQERLRSSSEFKDHALVFIHGFNTSFDFALYRTAQMAYDLKFDGAPFVYSWPSQGKVLSYPTDREGAQQAQPYLRDFLRMVVEKSGAKVVSIVAHSMGTQLLMPVLKDLKSKMPEGVRLSQVIWAAPDMDRDGFANFVQELQGISQGMTLYAHADDGALEISRKFWGATRAGDVPAGGPVIVAGLDTIDVSALSTDIFDLNHSGFAERTELLEDIGRLIKLGTRPPEKRLTEMKRVETDKGSYWRYQR
jgi:esterase/lipase superfamily enzyme